jgi:hypothetical protein
VRKLINKQTLPVIKNRMSPVDWKQWAMERLSWVQEDVEEAFWSFMDQRRKNSLNVSAADLIGNKAGLKAITGGIWKMAAEGQQKLTEAKVSTANVEILQGHPSKKCRFPDTLGCIGMHPLWKCRPFGDIMPEERDKIIRGNGNMPV